MNRTEQRLEQRWCKLAAPWLAFGVLATGGCTPAANDFAKLPRLDCALDGAAGFRRQCALATQGHQIVVYRPDGGFRRLIRVDDGRGVVMADGADRAQVQWAAPGLLEVAVAGDKFRFPARMRA